MNESTTRVGNLPLPGALLQMIRDGRWMPPRELATIADVFRDEPDEPHFYDLPAMLRQNQSFQGKSQADLAEMVFGSDRGLGINPALAVLVGDLGADMPIALDYRADKVNPRVIYLGSEGWYEVAPDFETLVQWLSI